MPHIETPTLAGHRDWRRAQLIDAAAAIAIESGGFIKYMVDRISKSFDNPFR